MRTETIRLTPEVEELLTEVQLPVADLAGRHRLQLLAIRDAGRLMGVVGVELYGHVGLLRSLAVKATHRNSGLGISLVKSAEAWAAAQGVETLYLLTTTAAQFFAKLGYEEAPRSEAPAPIASTTQFRELCPASSTLMRKELAAQQGRHP